DGADAGDPPARDDAGRDGHPARVADERHRLACLEDLPGEREDLRRAAEDVGRVAAENHEAVEPGRAHRGHRRVRGPRVAPLAGIGLLAEPGHDGARALLRRPDRRVPGLEVLVLRGAEEEDGPSGECHGSLPYFRIAATSRSAGRACTRIPSAPVIVSAASMALRIASSVASTVASKSGFIRGLSSIVTGARPSSPVRTGWVEKAKKMSPELSSPRPPIRPMASGTRSVIRLSWW